MSTLETQYKNWILKNPEEQLTYVEWLEKFNEINNLQSDISDWDATLMDGLHNEPYISDDFQIGPDGAYEHNEDITSIIDEAKMVAQQELINLLYSQVVDLSMMSKIELGDDVIAEIRRLQEIINDNN